MSQPLSAVNICSNALNLLGEKSITSLTDGSVRANLCNAHFGAVRDEELQLLRPTFSRKFRTMVAGVAVPNHTWGLLYQLPSDYLTMFNVTPRRTEYQIVGDQIYTNETALYIEYVARTEDTTKWSPLFAQLIMYRVAERIAPVLKAEMREAMKALGDEAERKAWTSDSQSESTVIVDADDLLDVR